LTHRFVKDISGLVEGISPTITPALSAKVGGLLNTASVLLTDKSIEGAAYLIGNGTMPPNPNLIDDPHRF
jgi:hypothetical protein